MPNLAMPPSDRLALKALASEIFTWPLPAVLSRALAMEVLPHDGSPGSERTSAPRPTRIVRVELVGAPPLPEELDELYAAAMPGIEVQVRWR